MPTSMTRMASTICAIALIERIGRDIGNHFVVKHAGWCDPLQVKRGRWAIKIPGKRFVCHNELNDFATGYVYGLGVWIDNDRSRG